MTIITSSNGRKYAVLKTGNPAKPKLRMTLGTTSAAEAKKAAKDAKLHEIEAALQLGQLSQQAGESILIQCDDVGNHPGVPVTALGGRMLCRTHPKK